MITNLKQRLRNAADPGSRVLCRTALEYIEQQESAIWQLREAIATSMESSQWPHVPFMIRARIEAALAVTEGL